MKNRWRVGWLLALLVLLSGCVSQEDHDQLRAEFEYLRTQLNNWSDDVYDWQSRTYVVICDIYRKNTPDRPPPNPAYAAETVTYCGPAEGGEPDEPPDWGPPPE